MKSLFYAGLLCLCSVFLFQCSNKDDDNDDQSGAIITARAEHNTSNFGVYKGVFVGSTGIVVISLRNDNNNISALLRIDGTLFHFTTTGILEVNKPTQLEFKSGNSSFRFEVGAEGVNPTISALSIEGHPDANIILFKELSDALVKCYEGTYAGSQQGTWNMVVKNDLMLGLVKSALGTAIATGIVEADQSTSGEVSSGATFKGKFNGDKVSGTWENNSGNTPESGTWEGTRTY